MPLIKPTPSDTRPGRLTAWKGGATRPALGLLLLLHLGATCVFFSPAEALRPEPLHAVDYPVHTHRVYMYRQGLRESGLPWGYDPAVAAGAVMNPGQDLGAKPLQVLGGLLPFLSPGAVVRLFLFLAALTFPLWPLLACRRLGLPENHQVWSLALLLGLAWLDPRLTNYWHWGLASFITAAFFSTYVLALFLNVLARPTVRRYLGFVLAATMLFLLHVLGPVIILAPLVCYTLTARPLSWRRRSALLSVPLIVLVLNAFWAVPALFAQHLHQPAGFAPRYPPGSVTHLRHGTWSELVDRIADPLAFGPLLLGVGLALYGLVLLSRSAGRRVSVSLGLVCGIGLFLTYAGSFVPVVAKMQPIRFLVPTFVFMTIPVGTALATLAGRFRIPAGVPAAGVAFILILGVILLDRPAPLALPPSPHPLSDFVARHTGPADRLLIQSPDGYRYDGYETKIFPLMLGREVIGSNFQVIYDPPQFLATMVLGRTLSAWSPEALREALTRWGVAWVFTVTPDARTLLTATLGDPEAQVGTYYAFRVPEPPTRFLLGTGQVAATVNRLELTHLRPENGLVVLRYRYNPGWRATPDIPLYSFSVPEDPTGFIAFKNPPASVTLRFDPWAMLRASWPAQGIAVPDAYPPSR